MEKIKLYRCATCTRIAPCYTFRADNSVPAVCPHSWHNPAAWEETDDFTIQKPAKPEYLLSIRWTQINSYNVPIASMIVEAGRDNTCVQVQDWDVKGNGWVEIDEVGVWVPKEWLTSHTAMHVEPRTLIDAVKSLCRNSTSVIPAIKFYRDIAGVNLVTAKEEVLRIKETL